MIPKLADKARSNRRAALAALNARIARSSNVVPIFDRVSQRRVAVPEFHTTRDKHALGAPAATVLVLTDPVAA